MIWISTCFFRLNAKKEAQEKRLKERLEEMKRKKEKTMYESTEPVDRIEDLERYWPIKIDLNPHWHCSKEIDSVRFNVLLEVLTIKMW